MRISKNNQQLVYKIGTVTGRVDEMNKWPVQGKRNNATDQQNEDIHKETGPLVASLHQADGNAASDMECGNQHRSKP